MCCPHCGDPLLLPGCCPRCAAQEQRHAKAKRLREKRAAYDSQHAINAEEFWQIRRWYPHCPSCGRPWHQIPEPLCQDHIIPLSRGGPNHSGNLQPLCHACNLWKRDYLICFDPHSPGYPQPLPQRLHLAFLALPHYQPHAFVRDTQLSLGLDHDGDPPHYPRFSPAALQEVTLRATWKQLGIG